MVKVQGKPLKSIEIPEIYQEIPRNREKSIYDIIGITL